MQIDIKTKCAIMATVFFWASAFVGIRAGLEEFSPGGLALLRHLIASMGMLVLFFYRIKLRKKLNAKDLFLALLTGIIGIGIYNISLNYGEQIVPAGISSFIVSQSPIITTVAAAFLLHEKMTKLIIVGMLISALGVGMLTLGDVGQFDFYIGIFYILMATIVSALYSLFQKSLLKKYSVIDLTACAIWGGALVLLIFIDNLYQDLQHVTWKGWAIVIYLGVFPSVISYLAWSYTLSKIPTSQAVSFLYFTPIVTTIIGWVWLQETLSWFAFFGGVMAMLGVWFVNKSFKSPKLLKIAYEANN